MEFEVMFEKAIRFHGHKCVGLVLGTRIAVAGLHKLGISDSSRTRDLVVYVARAQGAYYRILSETQQR